MKTSSLISKLTSHVFFISLLLLLNFQAFGQSCGSITISTQAQIYSFGSDYSGCTSINGNLIIDDGGTGNITDLNPLFSSFLTGATITGNLTITNCPGLLSLLGVDGILSVGNRFSIGNCANLAIISASNYPLEMTSIGEFLYIYGCPKLTNANAFINLKTVSTGIDIANNVSISDFSGFNNVTTSPVVEILNTNATSINGFNKLTSCGYLNISGNTSLTSVTGFNLLKNVQPEGGYNGNYNISYNVNLTSVNAHTNINSVNHLSVIGNTKLTACCFLLPIFDTNPSSVTINSNASGCNSVAQIDAPPTLTSCPSHKTISTQPGSCLGATSVKSPFVNDNCDFQDYEVFVLFAGGNTQGATGIPSGGTINLIDINPGITKVTYTATDQRGNSTNCTFNITVQDTEKPVLSNIPPNVTINCNDNFPTIPSPIKNDNCDNDPLLTVTSSLAMGSCSIGAPAEIHSYTWTLTDDSGNATTADWKVTVISDFSFNLGAPIEICDASSYIIDPGKIGESYIWSTGASSQALSVSSSGTYKVTITTKNGCCYESEKMITFSSPPNATAMGATLNCEASDVQIFGSSTASGAIYSWTGPGGFTSSMQNPMVSNTGEYILTVSNSAGCSSTTSAMVTGATDIPDVSTEGGSIDCVNTSIQLLGNSTSSGVTFSWTGPDGFTSDLQNPTVSIPGTYILSVESANGCTGNSDVIVADNTSPPEISLEAGTINCSITEIELSVEGDAVWSGPDGFNSTNEAITATVPGTYSVTVTGSNSCTNSGTVEILSDTTEPDISAEGGVINCVSGQTMISGSSTTVGATYSWTGPGDFTTEIQNPIAIIAGTYTLKVIAPNGCFVTQDVEVSADMDAPEVSVNDGSVDCINTSVDLAATSTSENITFTWVGPNGFTAEGPNINVTEPGEYLVMAINENGCAGSASSNVAANNIIPSVSVFVGPIGCQANDISFTTEVSPDVSTYSWTGPGDFTSEDKEPIITLIGTYTLTVTTENGCTAMTSFDVISDSAVPDASASVAGLLTCTQNTTALMGSSTSDTVSYLWTGPDGYSSNLQNPVVSQPGVYILSVIASNGCTGQSSVEVMGDGNLPIVNATGGNIDCDNISVILSGSTNLTDATFRWSGPNGFASSISNPEVDIPGEYTFTVTSASGCIAFKAVSINIDNQDPDLSLTEGFLNCDAGTRSFRVVTNAQDPNVSWTGPDDYTSSELNATYSKAGTYNLLVTGSNGCSSQLSIKVDFDIPYVHTLNITGNNASLEIEGGTPPFEITWDNDFIGSEISNLADGEHFVKIVDGLNCTKFVEFLINTSSITEIEEALELKIYPNPVVEELKVEWKTTNFEPKNLEIIDANGKTLKNFNISAKNNQLVDMSDLIAGIYFVRIEGKDSVIFRKFLKM